MITNCLAHQKTVLFVSQKTAALEAVRQRMHAIGLGNYCLEVHSTKAQKSRVLEQLAAARREHNLVTEEHWSAAASEPKRRRDQLNKLVSALHRRRPTPIGKVYLPLLDIGGQNALTTLKRQFGDSNLLATIGNNFAFTIQRVTKSRTRFAPLRMISDSTSRGAFTSPNMATTPCLSCPT
ncbi:hypothetical protein [Bradyrhizobium sp. DOA1]|uniref:hypothetical protein n=1 Tax=Bradyrhizobium sp. DOA1 TaxID=1126616 RepID=UPI00077CC37B|nr:hypothetical protein [Bradyrhizobium sp. DOA1]KYG97525.1 hypothetical protein SE91_02165 [Bradyrhizobium sp. DOA1]